MHSESIDKKTKLVLEKITEAKNKILKEFYLAGGTSLAIQLGHRKSIDLDWFIKKDFSVLALKKILSQLGKFELTGEERGAINGILDKVKVSFISYNYRQLYPFVAFLNVRLADERDVAAMKIDAISSRGSKKDFIDLFFLLKKYSLMELLGFFEKKYKNIKYNRLHILKSLIYFEDAEREPMPVMLKKTGWEEVKRKIEREVGILVK